MKNFHNFFFFFPFLVPQKIEGAMFFGSRRNFLNTMQTPLDRRHLLDKKKSKEFWEAIKKSDVPTLEELSKSSFIDLRQKHRGYTPLQWAVINRSFQVVNFLLKSANKEQPPSDYLNLSSSCGKTALAICLAKNKPPTDEILGIFFLLLEAGADVTCAEKDGTTALHLAAWGGVCSGIFGACQEDSIGLELLVSGFWRASGVTLQPVESLCRSIMKPCGCGCHATVCCSALIAQGADLFAQNQLRETPLHLAAERNRCGPAQVLIEGFEQRHKKHISNYLIGPFRITSLHKAVYGDSLEVLALFHKLGVDLNLRAPLWSHRYSLLNAAAHNNHAKVCRLLLALGVDPRGDPSTGMKPLHCAALNKQEDNEVIKYFAKEVRSFFVDGKEFYFIDQINNEGQTALIAAAKERNIQGVLKLLECYENGGYDEERKKKNLNHQDQAGRTALHWAAIHPSKFNACIYQLLVKAGADQHIQDQDGKTPCDYLKEVWLFSCLVNNKCTIL